MSAAGSRHPLGEKRSLLEPEQGAVLTAVIQAEDEPAAGVFPVSLRPPEIAVAIGEAAVAETIAAWTVGRFDVTDGRQRLTVDLLRGGIAGGEDVQALIAVQAEADQDPPLPGPAGIDLRRIFDRRQEAAEVIGVGRLGHGVADVG